MEKQLHLNLSENAELDAITLLRDCLNMDLDDIEDALYRCHDKYLPETTGFFGVICPWEEECKRLWDARIDAIERVCPNCHMMTADAKYCANCNLPLTNCTVSRQSEKWVHLTNKR